MTYLSRHAKKVAEDLAKYIGYELSGDTYGEDEATFDVSTIDLQVIVDLLDAMQCTAVRMAQVLFLTGMFKSPDDALTNYGFPELSTDEDD
jgi:hypothetical protein